MSINLASPAFADGSRIPVRYTQDGDNISPPLAWSNVPPAAQELAIVVDDPDAPTPQPFVHWVAHGIASGAPGVGEHVGHDAVPKTSAVRGQGRNSFDRFGYDGPAPPPGSGAHHYHFHVYALDKRLAADRKLDKAGLLAAMAGHIIDEGELVGTYERP